MTANSTLDCPPIQDTGFGDPQVLTVDGGVDPEDVCFCICACKDSSDKASNNRLTSAAVWASRDGP